MEVKYISDGIFTLDSDDWNLLHSIGEEQLCNICKFGDENKKHPRISDSNRIVTETQTTSEKEELKQMVEKVPEELTEKEKTELEEETDKEEETAIEEIEQE